MPRSEPYPTTPDGRYFVVRGRLWRLSNPALYEDTRQHLVRELMAARRAVRDAQGHPAALITARQRIDACKVALGERGAVWRTDGAPDQNRHKASTSSYSEWFAALPEVGLGNTPEEPG